MSAPVSLEAALAELAADPIGVLRASGVKGEAGICGWCPVAEFIRLRIGRAVTVSHEWVMVIGSEIKARLPEQVKQAIRAIDAGEHPELCR